MRPKQLTFDEYCSTLVLIKEQRRQVREHLSAS